MSKNWFIPSFITGVVVVVVAMAFYPRGASGGKRVSPSTAVSYSKTPISEMSVRDLKTAAAAKEPVQEKIIVSPPPVIVPKFEKTDDLYAWALEKKKEGEFEASLEGFEELIHRAPNMQKAHINHARLLLEIGSNAEAHKAAKRGARINPSDALTQNVLGLSYHALGMIPQAVAAYETAAYIDTSFAWACNNLGLINIQKEEFALAEPHLREAIRRDPTNAVFYNNLGISLERQGRFSEARQAYADAVEVKPDYTRAKLHLARIMDNKDIDPMALAKNDEAETIRILANDTTPELRMQEVSSTEIAKSLTPQTM